MSGAATVRERYAVILRARGTADPAEASPPPDLGVPAAWAAFEVQRALVLHYAAGEGQKLPQAAKVRAMLSTWAKAQGWGPVRLAVLPRLDPAEILRLLRAWDARRGAVGETVTMAYPLALPEMTGDTDGSPVSLTERLEYLTGALLPWYNDRLQELHRAAVLAEAPNWAKPVWKHGGLGEVLAGMPSRVGRCALETVGRVVASQAARREAFAALRAVWGPEVERLLAAGEPYPVVVQAREAWAENYAGNPPATGLLLGVAEQMAADNRRRTGMRYCGSTWAEWAAFCEEPAPAPWAGTYTDLQGAPTMSRFLLTYAADDGGRARQAARYVLTPDGQAVECALLLPARPNPGREDWSWCSFRLTLPEIVRAELARGGRLQAPDLRRTRAEQWVLDVKVEAVPRGERRGVPGRVLAFDWGLRKLLSAVVLQGGEPATVLGDDGAETAAEPPAWEQLSRPFFLRAGGSYDKLRELRVHAGFLRAKVDWLRHARHRAHPSEEERSAQAEWDAVWRRYEHLQEQLAHEASNFLLKMAVESGCSVIAGEWLGSLKSGTKSKDLNWRINSQIRSKILAKLRYKARRVGIRVTEVWPRGTSHRCPRCGADGQQIEDHPPCPLEKKPRRKPGAHGWAPGHAGTKHRPRRCSWFHCGQCGANGDRDYMAALNIGAEYLAEQAARHQAEHAGKRGRKLAKAAKTHRQGVSYTGASVARPFTSRNTWFPILSGRHGPRREQHGYRQWMRRGGGLCGWRGRYVRVVPTVCPWRLPVVA
jgi:IS605 OrfB family transposase